MVVHYVHEERYMCFLCFRPCFNYMSSIDNPLYTMLYPLNNSSLIFPGPTRP